MESTNTTDLVDPCDEDDEPEVSISIYLFNYLLMISLIINILKKESSSICLYNMASETAGLNLTKASSM